MGIIRILFLADTHLGTVVERFRIRGSQRKGWAADIIIGKMFGEFDIKAAGEGPPVLNNKNRLTENNYLLSDSDCVLLRLIY